MQFTFTLMDKSDLSEIQTWRYDEPYAIYNITAEPEDEPSEMLDRRSPYYAVRDTSTGELIGFFCFGTAAQPWSNDLLGLYNDDRVMDIGLGMKPERTGKGLGQAFVQAGLDFAREQFAPASFRLFVLAFNERAIRVYQKAGFQRERTLVQKNGAGERTFWEMRRDA